MRRIIALTLLTIVLAINCAAPAAEAQTVQDIERVWRDWMVKEQRSTGGLVVTHGGQPVHAAAMGRFTASAPVPLASLSKAVTGVCVASLIDAGRLGFDTRVATALARTLSRVGPPADPRLLQVTVGELLAHRAGFDGKDDVTSRPFAAYLQNHSARDTAFDVQLRWAIARRLPLQPGSQYAYSNAAYLMLGAIIEETTGQPYEAFCRQAVLIPLGVRDAELDPAWRILASYGGWRMPLADYGRFYQAFAVGNSAIGPVARQWMMNPPFARTERAATHYGLGTFVRPTREGGGNFWHWGRWTFRTRAGFDGPLDTSYSTFAVRLGALDVNMVVYLEPGLQRGPAHGELDRLLGQAAQSVTRWP
jgi:CubicO group peptidase (beta-lactamase class C family)